eukprot:c28934_g2_i2 orf=324-1340(+)
MQVKLPFAFLDWLLGMMAEEVAVIWLQEQQNGQNKSFSRRASLIYTPTPSRLGTENPAKGKRNRQLFQSKTGDMKDSVFWDDSEDQSSGNRGTHPEEIQMVECLNDAAAGNFVSKTEVLQLQSQIEQLEGKLQEKEKLLLAAEDNAKQIDYQLQQKVQEFQKDLLHKNQQIQDVHMELSGKQQEIATIHSILERAEANALESKRKALGIEEELNGLRCKVAVLLFQLENTQVESSSDYDGPVCDLPEQSAGLSMALKGQIKAEEQADWKLDEVELEHMESVRWKYVETIVAARENPGEELLLQAAELRAQLQAFLLRPTFSTLASDLLFSQAPRYSLY